jgi:hypothetical protein
MTWVFRDLDCELDSVVVCTRGFPFVRSRVDRLNGFGRFGGSERKEQKQMPFGDSNQCPASEVGDTIAMRSNDCRLI